MKRPPNFSPWFLSLLKAGGNDKYTSAVADTIDRVKNPAVRGDGIEDEGETKEHKRAMPPRSSPEATVNNVFSEEFTRSEDGFGEETRACARLIYESSFWLVVVMDRPVVGSGGGISSIDIQSAPWPVRVFVVSRANKTSATTPRTSAPLVAFRVLSVRLRLSHGVCIPGISSKAPKPAATATRRTIAVLAPPSCNDA